MKMAGNALTPEQWAKRITERWQSGAGDMLSTIIEVGQDLAQARAELKRGEYMLMFEERNGERKVPFSYSKANQVKRIGENPHILKFQHATTLPPDWSTLYLLTRLIKKDEALFYHLIDDGTIHSTMSRGEISKVLRLLRVAQDQERVLKLRPRPGKVRTIVLDPAWEYDWLSIAGRAKPGYAMQTVEQLYELNPKQWAEEECHLYCWVTNNFMAVACKLIEHWGFQHRTLITWVKPPPFGLGSYFRNSTEHVLFATLGETTTRPAAASIPTHFTAERGDHSEKPEAFYEIVRAASYPPYGEANQRVPRPDFVNLFELAAEAAE